MDTEELKRNFEAICPNLTNFNRIVFLDVIIVDYTGPIVNGNYILASTADKKDNLKNIFDNMFTKDDPVSQKCKYIFAYNDNGFGLPMSFERFSVYLHNKYSTSLTTKYSGITVLFFDTVYMDWTKRCPPTNNQLNITISDFNEIFKLKSKEPSMLDFDVQLIMNKIRKNNNNYLFRGVANFYSENDGLSSSNYRRHKDFAESGMLQNHEREIVEKLISNSKVYNSTDPVCALTDLRHRGLDTNTLDWSADYRVALFFACEKGDIAEFMQLPKSNFEIMKNFEYPLNMDFILYPNYDSNNSKRVDAQSSIFIYCHRGYLPRDEYDGIIENVLIPQELKGLLMNYCAIKKSDIYPDFDGYMESLKSFKSDVSKLHEPVDNPESYKNAVSYIDKNLNRFDTHYFLDVEVDDYSGPVVTENYAMVKVDNKTQQVSRLRGVFGPKFTGNEISDLRFMLGSNDKFIRDKFVQYIKEKYPNSYNEYEPVFFTYFPIYGDYADVNYPKDKKLCLTMKEVDKIVSCG